MSAGAILLCGGRGERLAAGVEKAFAPLAGRPLWTWSLEALERTPAIEAIVVVGAARRLEDSLAGALVGRKIVAFVEGGRERQDSVAKGLGALPERFTPVVIHDSARALVTPDLVGRVIGDALATGAAIAAIPVDDTLKRASLEVIESTVPRAGLWRAQTPQVFRRDWIVAAHAAAHGKATDDAALVEALGHRVKLTLGDPLNLKITTERDRALAEAWLEARATAT